MFQFWKTEGFEMPGGHGAVSFEKLKRYDGRCGFRFGKLKGMKGSVCSVLKN